MAIFSIIKSDLKTKKGNMISILFLVFLISISLTSIISVNLGEKERIKKACDASNVADIVSYIKKDKLTPQIKRGLETSSLVKKVEILSSYKSRKCTVNGKDAKDAIFFLAYEPSIHSYEFYNHNLRSFRKDNEKKPEKGEVFLPVVLQNLYQCNLGDSLKIQTIQGTHTYKITRFYEEPFAGTSIMGIKNALMNEEDLKVLEKAQNDEELEGFSIVNIFVKDNNKHNIRIIKKELNDQTGYINNSLITLLRVEANDYTLAFVKIFSGILWTFAMLLFAATLIIIGHSVSSSIEMDYVSFGILKSQGFTSLQIRMILLIEYLLAGASGGVFGILLSCIVVKYLNQIFIPISGLLVTGSIKIIESLGVLLILLLLITIYTYFKTRKIVSISPVQAISLGREPIYFSSHIDFSITRDLPFSLNIKLIIKNVVGNLKRYISTIIIMAILTFFAMTITSLQQMNSDENADSIFGYISSDISIHYRDPKNVDFVKEMRDYIEDKATITKEFRMDNTYFVVEGMEFIGHVISEVDSIITSQKGRLPKYDSEIVITDLMSKEIKKSIGDTVTIETDNNKAEYIITGIYQNTSDAGKNFSMLETGRKQLDADYTINSVEYRIKDKDQSKEITKYLQEKYKKTAKDIKIIDVYSETQEESQTITVALNAMTAGTYIFTIIFVAVVAFMICNKMFRRDQVDFGIYKSIGFTTASLRGQFIVRFLLVVLLGGGVGILFNFLLNDTLLSILLQGVGVSHIETKYTMVNLLLPIACISGFSIIFSFLVSGKIKRVTPKNLIQE